MIPAHRADITPARITLTQRAKRYAADVVADLAGGLVADLTGHISPLLWATISAALIFCIATLPRLAAELQTRVFLAVHLAIE